MTVEIFNREKLLVHDSKCTKKKIAIGRMGEKR